MKFSDFLYSYLSESTFSREDWTKHNHKYSYAVIDELLTEQAIATTSHRLPTCITADMFDRDKLINLRANLKTSTPEDLQACLLEPAPVKIWPNLAKRTFTAIYEASRQKHAANRLSNAAAEMCFLYYLDMMIDNNGETIPFGKRSDKGRLVANYKPSKRIINNPGGTLISTTLAELRIFEEKNPNDDWLTSNKNSAKTFYKKFGNIGDYEFHYQSTKKAEYIRKRGKELASLVSADLDINENKWCPADVYFIKAGAQLDESKTTNIFQYNDYIGSEVYCIPVSLKKEASDSLGAVSATKIRKQFEISNSFNANKIANLQNLNSQAVLKMIRRLMKSIQQKDFSDIVNVFYNDSDILDALQNKQIQDNEWYNNTNTATILSGLGFLANIKAFNHTTEYETLSTIVATTFLKARGMSDISCDHWFLANGSLTHVDVNDPPDIKLIEIRIPLSINKQQNRRTATQTVIYRIEVNGVAHNLEHRSKHVGKDPVFDAKVVTTTKERVKLKKLNSLQL